MKWNLSGTLEEARRLRNLYLPRAYVFDAPETLKRQVLCTSLSIEGSYFHGWDVCAMEPVVPDLIAQLYMPAHYIPPPEVVADIHPSEEKSYFSNEELLVFLNKIVASDKKKAPILKAFRDRALICGNPLAPELPERGDCLVVPRSHNRSPFSWSVTDPR